MYGLCIWPYNETPHPLRVKMVDIPIINMQEFIMEDFRVLILGGVLSLASSTLVSSDWDL